MILKLRKSTHHGEIISICIYILIIIKSYNVLSLLGAEICELNNLSFIGFKIKLITNKKQTRDSQLNAKETQRKINLECI